MMLIIYRHKQGPPKQALDFCERLPRYDDHTALRGFACTWSLSAAAQTTRIKTREEKDIAEWIGIIRKQDANLPVILVGTKIDKPSDFMPTDEEINTLKTKFNLFNHIKISSLTDEGITEAFRLMVNEVARVHNIDVGDKSHFVIEKGAKK
jgi:GTPase SAR1 family protein